MKDSRNGNFEKVPKHTLHTIPQCNSSSWRGEGALCLGFGEASFQDRLGAAADPSWVAKEAKGGILL